MENQFLVLTLLAQQTHENSIKDERENHIDVDEDSIDRHTKCTEDDTNNHKKDKINGWAERDMFNFYCSLLFVSNILLLISDIKRLHRGNRTRALEINLAFGYFCSSFQ